MPTLEDLGFDSGFESSFASLAKRGLAPGRVISVHRGAVTVFIEGGEVLATASGRLLEVASSPEARPVVGDWVGLREGSVLDAICARRTVLVRRAAGGSAAPQLLAANVDVLLAVMALDADFNVRRLERYAALAAASGVELAVLLTKEDLLTPEEVSRRLDEARGSAPGAAVLAVSGLRGRGVDALKGLLEPRRTYALLGSSGAGKSTLVNALLGRERQATAAVRAGDGRGRHTTTRRELIRLPSGALLVDTPGLREVGLWLGGEGVSSAFPEIEEAAARCRFRDCSHGSEPGCAVRVQVAEGRLDPARLASLGKLRREEAFLERRLDPRKEREEKLRWKKLTNGAWEASRAKRRRS